jgi:predicted enzyme related to lactoylglutathione lyase
MAAPVVHFEIGCRNLETTKKFFGELFGWEYESHGPAAMLKNLGGPGKDGIGGHINCLGHEPHQYVTVYALVDDLQKTLDHAAKLGGKTVVPPQEVPGMGSFAWLSSPEGHIVGIWKALKA